MDRDDISMANNFLFKFFEREIEGLGRKVITFFRFISLGLKFKS